MVTPMPLTSFYWQITAETDSAYITKYKSIFSDHLSGSGDYRPKNHHLLKQIDWNGENRIHQIKYITKDFYAIEQHHDSLFIFDIRFGMTKKLSGNNVNEPIMGYGILLNNRKPVNYFGYRTTAFGQIEFWTYVDYVFGSEAQIIND
jgi:inner membrane protein